MKKFTAKSQGFREFELLGENNIHLGKIIYPKWYSYEVDIFTLKGNSSVKMEGFWGNHIVHYSAAKEVLRKVEHTWKGIVFEEKSGEKYFLSTEGFLNFQFKLKTESGEEVLTAKPVFHWKSLNSDYEIEVNERFSSDAEFILFVIHCVNYQMQLLAAASG